MRSALIVFRICLVSVVILSCAALASADDVVKILKEGHSLKDKAITKGDFQKALEKYQSAQRLAEKSGDWKNGCWALFGEGSVLWNLGQNEDALASYEKALVASRKGNNPNCEAVTLGDMANIYRERGEYDKALKYYEKALEGHRRTRNVKEEGSILLNISNLFIDRAQYDKAQEYAQKGLEIARKVGDKRREAVAYARLGLVHLRRSEYVKAADAFEECLKTAKNAEYTQFELEALNNLSDVYRDRGQYNKALEYAEKGLDRAKTLGRPWDQKRAMDGLAHVFQYRGEYDKAVEWNEQALALIRKMGAEIEEPPALGKFGQICRARGQYAEAVGYAEQSLAKATKMGKVRDQGFALGDLGAIFAAWGQYDKSAEYYNKALEIHGRIGNVDGQAATLINLAKICGGRGQYVEAIAHYEKALAIQKRIGVPTKWAMDSIGNVYLDMGDVQKAEPFIKEAGYWASQGRLSLAQGDYPSAKTHYESLLKSAEKSRNADNLFTAFTGLGKTCEALEDYKKAQEYYEKGMKLTEELRSSLAPAERKDFFEVKIAGFSRSEPAKGLTRVRMKLNQGTQSIDSSEVTRARSFSDGIAQRSQAGVSGVPQDILIKEEDLLTRIAALRTQRGKVDKDKNQERYSNITQDIEKVEAELKQLVETLWEKYTPYAAVKYPRPVTLKESALKPDEWVIVYDVSGEGIGIKLIKGKEIIETHYAKLRIEDLEREVRKFRQSFEDANFKEFDPELGRSLYKRLLLSVLAHVPEGNPIVIIPDGILAVLPFEALVVSGKSTWKKAKFGDYPEGLTYCEDIYPISYYQSITALTLARAMGQKTKPGERLLVMADPVFDMKDRRAQGARETMVATKDEEQQVKLMAAMEENSGLRFARLPETAILASNLGSLFKGQCDLYTGMDATKQRFMKSAPELDRYRWAVFATHGVFSAKIPGLREPFLALTTVPPGTDGLLTLSDVMSLRLNADLVALTACQTGLGKELSGEGVMSMGRAFQYAGARSILMSLWSVEEKASVELVESFFRQMKEGKSKLEALKIARGDVRKAGYEHPFFWAPFILVGEVK